LKHCARRVAQSHREGGRTQQHVLVLLDLRMEGLRDTTTYCCWFTCIVLFFFALLLALLSNLKQIFSRLTLKKIAGSRRARLAQKRSFNVLLKLERNGGGGTATRSALRFFDAEELDNGSG